MKAKELLRLSESQKKDCSKVSSVEDINAMFDYEDKYPRGENDEKLISCGQSKRYNELKRFYYTYLEPFVKNGILTKDQALKTMCECCKKFNFQERTHDEFKKCVFKKISDKFKTLKRDLCKIS